MPEDTAWGLCWGKSSLTACTPLRTPARTACRNKVRYEALAVVRALRRFRAYLLGLETVMYTDDAALKSLLNTRWPSDKLARWAMTIQEIDPDIRHRSGRKNGNADALSRAPLATSDVDQGVESEPHP